MKVYIYPAADLASRKGVDFSAGADSAFKATLHSNAYTFSDAHDAWADVSESELSTGNGYTQGGVSVVGRTITTIKPDAVSYTKFDFTSITFPLDAPKIFQYVIIRNDSDDVPWFCIDLEEDISRSTSLVVTPNAIYGVYADAINIDFLTFNNAPVITELTAEHNYITDIITIAATVTDAESDVITHLRFLWSATQLDVEDQASINSAYAAAGADYKYDTTDSGEIADALDTGLDVTLSAAIPVDDYYIYAIAGDGSNDSNWVEGDETFAVTEATLTTDNLVFHLNARKNNGTTYANDADPWVDLAGTAQNADLVNFGSSETSGWNGDGSGGNPYRLVFDGTNDNCKVTRHADLEPTTAISVECWIRTLTLLSGHSTDYPQIIMKGQQADNKGYMLTFLKPNNQLYFTFYSNGEWHTLFASVSTWDTTNYHHVVATFDGRYAKIFVDNAQIGSTLDLGGTYAITQHTTQNMFIGAYGSTGDAFYAYSNIAIPVIRVYSAALTIQQITDNYNYGFNCP